MSENGTNRFSSEKNIVIVYVAAVENVFRFGNIGDLTRTPTWEGSLRLRTYGHIMAPRAICKWHIMSFQPKKILFAHKDSKFERKIERNLFTRIFLELEKFSALPPFSTPFKKKSAGIHKSIEDSHCNNLYWKELHFSEQFFSRSQNENVLIIFLFPHFALFAPCEGHKCWDF